MTSCAGSLEDCFTNVFALSELNSLKWKRLTTPDGFTYSPELGQDPIIRAYEECVQQNIYCAWRRRVQGEDAGGRLENLPLRSYHPKEFFVFWFTIEEPPLIQKLLDGGLIAPDESDTTDQTIRYETRCLFFNALHHVTERTLFQEGYVRFGHWFVLPLEEEAATSAEEGNTPANHHQQHQLPAYQLGFQFHYHVQGDNPVLCATVKSQKQPPVLRVSRRMLRLNRRIDVVLAPWSMRATLLPDQPLFGAHAARLNDEVKQKAEQAFAVWRNLYPAPADHRPDDEAMDCKPAQDQPTATSSTPEDSDAVPRMLLLELGGMRVFCPHYLVGVLLTDLEQAEAAAAAAAAASSAPSDSSARDHCTEDDVGLQSVSLVEQLDRKRRKRDAQQKILSHIPDALRHNRKSYVGLRVGGKDFENACLAPSQLRNQPPTAGGGPGHQLSLQTTEDVRFVFMDYASKTRAQCNCSKVCAGEACPPAPPTKVRTLFHHGSASTSQASSTLARNPVDLEEAEDEHLLKALEQLAASDDGEDTDSELPAFAAGVPHSPRRISDRLDLDLAKADLSHHVGECMKTQFHADTPDVPYPAPVRPFSPISNINCEPPEGINAEKYRNYSYHYNALKRDIVPQEPYHFAEPRDKPLGPQLNPAPAADSAPTNPDLCRRAAALDSLRRLLAEEAEQSAASSSADWLQHIGQSLRSRWARRRPLAPADQQLTRREQQARQLLGALADDPLHRVRSLPVLNENSNPLDSLFNPLPLPGTALAKHGGQDQQMLSPSATASTTRPATPTTTATDPLKRRARSRRATSLSPVRNYDPLHVSVHCNEEEALSFLHRGPMERVIRTESEMVVDTPPLSTPSEKDPDESFTCEELKRTLAEDTMDVEDPRTPGSALGTHHAVGAHEPAQLFSSAGVSSAGEFLSPPASNERVEAGLSMAAHLPAQTAVAALANQPHQTSTASQLLAGLPAQSLAAAPGTAADALILHTNSWNSTHVTTNTNTDSLSVIYPTPPTPIQQFSPLNLNVLEDPAHKKAGLRMDPDDLTMHQQHQQQQHDQLLLPQQTVHVFNEYRQKRPLVRSPSDTSDMDEEVPNIFRIPSKKPLAMCGQGLDLLDDRLDLRTRLRHEKTAPPLKKTLKKALQKRAARARLTQAPTYLSLLKLQQQQQQQTGPGQEHKPALPPANLPMLPSAPPTMLDFHRNPTRMAEHSLNLLARRRPFASFGLGVLKPIAASRRSLQLSLEQERARRQGHAQAKLQLQHQQQSRAAMFQQQQQHHQQQQHAMMMNGAGPGGPMSFAHPQQQQQQAPNMMLMQQHQQQQQQQQMMAGGAGTPGAVAGRPQFPQQPYLAHNSPGMRPGGPQQPPLNFQQQQQQQQQQQFMQQQRELQMRQRAAAAQAAASGQPFNPQAMPMYFNGQAAAAAVPSPASSMYSNPQSVPPPSSVPPPASNAGGMPSVMDGRPGSVQQQPQQHMAGAPSPFGSPLAGSQMVGSVGAAGGGNFPMHRTPASTPQSVPPNFVDPQQLQQQQQRVAGTPQNKQLALSAARQEELCQLLGNPTLWTVSVTFMDTFMNIFRDPIFDACPICSCNANIRSAELGVYVQVPPEVQRVDQIAARQQEDPSYKPDFWSGLMKNTARGTMKCSCGFSAVRYRLLAAAAQCLFPDDHREALTVSIPPNVAARSLLILFRKFVDALRFTSPTFELCRFANCYYGDLADAWDRVEALQQRGGNLQPLSNGTTGPRPSAQLPAHTDNDYLLSKVETDEFDLALSTLLSSANNRPSVRTGLFHPFGLQLAQNVAEPRDNEYVALVREIQPVLEAAIKRNRGSEFTGRGNIVEGPLTWRQFHKKAVKAMQDDDSFKPELIPNVLVTAEKEPVATNPQLVHMWEKLTLGPYDQPKDVMYLAVVPEGNLIVEKCRVFLEELSTTYERCRFGRHVRVQCREGRVGADPVLNGTGAGPHASNSPFSSADGFIRVPGTRPPNTQDGNKHTDRELSKLSGYNDNALSAVRAFMQQHDYLFERRTFFEHLYRDSLRTNFTSLAAASTGGGADNTSTMGAMGPPALPGSNPPSGVIQSPSSVLSTQSGGGGGPASHGALLMNSATGQPAATPPGLNNNNQHQSPQVGAAGALNPHSNEMLDSIRTPENPAGTPGGQQQQHLLHQQQHHDQNGPNPASEQAVEKAVDEMMTEEIPHALPHMIVIYVVNPFLFGSESYNQKTARAVMMMLARMVDGLMRGIERRFRPQVQVELLNVQTVFDFAGFMSGTLREERQVLEPVEVVNREKLSAQDNLRRLAFSVYSQTRLLAPESVRGVLVKSMTRFGPAASMNDTLDALRSSVGADDDPLFFKIPVQPFVLAPKHTIGMLNASQKFHLLNPEERVLFVSYCLTTDGTSLCASVTDQHGHLCDNAVINLSATPAQGQRYKLKSQIYDAIFRLWLYIQSVLVMDTRNWRLVITRVGKMGHGEFRVWSQILSRKTLRAFNSNLRVRADKETACRACAVTQNMQEVPVIMSACLVSMEAEPNLRLFPAFGLGNDSGTSTRARGAAKNAAWANQLSLLDDPSVTHLITFQTSPEISECSGEQNQVTDDDDFLGIGGTLDDTDEFNDLFNTGELLDDEDNGKQETTIDHQPMATGYMISTAPATDLPDWFWARCPNARRHLPVHLRNALHINCFNLNEDIGLGQGPAKNGNETFHPLDEQTTDVILRYVMQMHNALSWLNVDVGTGARHSCLPVHMQNLFRLYHNFERVTELSTSMETGS